MISTLKNQHTNQPSPWSILNWRYCMIMVCYGRYWPSGMIFLQNSTFDRLVAHWQIFLILFTLLSKHVIWPNQLAPEILATKWPNCSSAKKSCVTDFFMNPLLSFIRLSQLWKYEESGQKLQRPNLSLISSLYSSLSCFILFSFLFLFILFSLQDFPIKLADILLCWRVGGWGTSHRTHKKLRPTSPQWRFLDFMLIFLDFSMIFLFIADILVSWVGGD